MHNEICDSEHIVSIIGWWTPLLFAFLVFSNHKDISQQCRRYFKRRKVVLWLIEWPALSPDLNLIKLLREELNGKV